MTARLKACPFCGGKAKMHTVVNALDDVGADIHNEGGQFIACVDCDASSTMMFPLKDSVDDLLGERWNRRALPRRATRKKAKRC